MKLKTVLDSTTDELEAFTKTRLRAKSGDNDLANTRISARQRIQSTDSSMPETVYSGDTAISPAQQTVKTEMGVGNTVSKCVSLSVCFDKAGQVGPLLSTFPMPTMAQPCPEPCPEDDKLDFIALRQQLASFKQVLVAATGELQAMEAALKLRDSQ